MSHVGMILLLMAVEPLERVGRLEAPEIREASGLVRSRKHPGVFRVHDDSKNPATLFAVDGAGKLIRSYQVEAFNVDWEDIATDEQGHLFPGDIGNNDNRLPIRAVYRFDAKGMIADGPWACLRAGQGWDGDDLRLASEDRSLSRISKARWTASR